MVDWWEGWLVSRVGGQDDHVITQVDLLQLHWYMPHACTCTSGEAIPQI